MPDHVWMQRCLELAKKGQGRTAPNPMVGSVIVKNGKLLGEGYHPQAGQPHAEVFAIRDAQSINLQALAGATLYVNLEPCNHFGRTPPCTEAIIRAGIGRVVVGMIDPDRRVAGQGCDRLRQAGIEVTEGVMLAECGLLNEGFVHRVKFGVPFGILKYAMTLDGKIATHTGHSQWITGASARTAVHYLRASCDAVITGGNTVRQDNPHLTTHGLTEHCPLRVVMSRSLDLPKEANLWNCDRHTKTLVVTLINQNPAMQAYLSDRGVEILELEQLDPQFVMPVLAKRGCNKVLWECGGELAARAIAAKAVQKVYAFIAPKIIGGQNAPTPVGDLGFSQMTQALSLTRTSIERFDQDWAIIGYLE